jgi:hypothetical protein
MATWRSAESATVGNDASARRFCFEFPAYFHVAYLYFISKSIAQNLSLQSENNKALKAKSFFAHCSLLSSLFIRLYFQPLSQIPQAFDLQYLLLRLWKNTLVRVCI